MTTWLAIGDVHIRIDNLEDIHRLMERVEELIQTRKPTFIMLLGDILHTHERIHTTCLQYAERLFTMCSSYCHTYVLIGNHDYISNSQFLTSHHWMTPFKQWPNLTIVDKVSEIRHEHQTFIACPYVPDGRMIEALSTVPTWKKARLIFGHQTLDGVYMGAIKTEHVEEWLPEYPFLCSGHIHDKQRVQPNLYYTGTPMQQAFGEKRNKSVAFFTVNEQDIQLEEIELKISVKRIEYITVQEAYHYSLTVDPYETVRLTIKGTREECNTFKKTPSFQKLIKLAKVVFDELQTTVTKEETTHSFHEVLYRSVQSNFFMSQLYKRHANLPSFPELVFE